MPSFPQSAFPTMQTIMDLCRSMVNDMYPGVGGQNGRILTNDAAFTIPYFNSALRTLQRKLRLQGVTFPIKDNVILANVTPVATVSTSTQVFINFDGYFDGVVLHDAPRLPGDCMQVFTVWEQTAGSNSEFVEMGQSQGGLPSALQGAWMKMWEWRQYGIYMIGSTETKNLRIRYQSGQPPLDVPAADFETTPVSIIDCEDAMASLIAIQYARARGAADTTNLEAAAEDAISDMAEEWVKRQQTQTFRRPAYGEGGSGVDGNTIGRGSL